MRAHPAHRRLTTWIAALAILLAALAPSLSHAWALAGGSGWVEVCTTQGSQWVQVGEDEAERAPPSARVQDHCPYCSLHATTLGLPPAVPTIVLALRPSGELAHAFPAAPRTLHAWVSAQPRAPPLRS